MSGAVLTCGHRITCGAQYSRHRGPAEFLESLRAATDGIAALWSYKHDTVGHPRQDRRPLAAG